MYNKLPEHLICKIYEYDLTYKKIYDNCLEQLKALKEDLDKYGIFSNISHTLLLYNKHSPNLYLD